MDGGSFPMGKQQPPWSKPWQIDDSARHEASAAANSEEPGRPSADHLISWHFCFLKDMFVTVIFKQEKRHSAHPLRRSPHHTVGIATRATCWTLQSQEQKGPLCNGWLAHTLTSCCMAKILSSFYTSSRLWLRINGRAEERYPIRRASVLPLQVVERRLGLSGLSWLSSLESGVFVGNCADFLPYRDVTRQQSYRDIKIWVTWACFPLVWQLPRMLDNAELAMLKAASEILRITLGSIQVGVNLFICLIPWE